VLWEAFFVSPTSYKIKTYELILAIFKISYVIVDVVAVVVVVGVIHVVNFQYLGNCFIRRKLVYNPSLNSLLVSRHLYLYHVKNIRFFGEQTIIKVYLYVFYTYLALSSNVAITHC